MINSKSRISKDGYHVYSSWFDSSYKNPNNYVCTVTDPKRVWFIVTETAPTELGAVRKALRVARRCK